MWHWLIATLFPGAQKAVKTVLEGAIVLKVNAKAGNALVLQLDVNVTLMFAEIAGSGTEFSCMCFSCSLKFLVLPVSCYLETS